LLIAGGIDLSVASILAMATVVLGWSYRAGVPLVACVLLAMASGAMMGAINGACVAYLRLPPVIVTLATMALFRGLAIGVTGGSKVSGFPEGFLHLGQGQLRGIVPVQLPLLAALAGLTWFVLHRTVWGRHIFAVGANETAARFSGVPIEATKFWLYVASGFFAGLAGVLYVARFNTAKADAQMGAELDVITAVLLGGTPLTGGEGSLTGTLLALLLLCTLRRGLDMLQVGTEQQAILTGALLIAAVALSQWRRKLR
jgi:rhamnose transport system permease protein